MSAFGTALGNMGSTFGTAIANYGGSGIGGALFGGITAKRQWKYAQKQMALQQQYALEQMQKSAEYQLTHDKTMFDYENAYNEPTKVFERFAQAGMNPAAVLGSSGASIGATIGTGSGSAPSASGPSGPGGNYGGALTPAGDALALSQGMLMASQRKKADADARLANAEAARTENETQDSDYYRNLADLNRQLLEHKVTDQAAIAAYDRALATITEATAVYADSTATYQYHQVISDYAKTVEEYMHLKAVNNAEIPIMDQLVAANLSLTLAQAYASNARGSLDSVLGQQASVELKDLQNWFSVNWETSIDVPEVDEHGKPTGKTKKMTGKEIQSYLLGLSTASAGQDLPANWFNIRSQKNQFGYSMVKTVLAAAAAGLVSRGRSAGVPADFEQTTAKSDRNGEFVGGTSVRRTYLPRR